MTAKRFSVVLLLLVALLALSVSSRRFHRRSEQSAKVDEASKEEEPKVVVEASKEVVQASKEEVPEVEDDEDCSIENCEGFCIDTKTCITCPNGGRSNLEVEPFLRKDEFLAISNSKIVIVGDIHGDFEMLEVGLVRAGLITVLKEKVSCDTARLSDSDKEKFNPMCTWSWVGGDAVLVQTGDLVDAKRAQSPKELSKYGPSALQREQALEASADPLKIFDHLEHIGKQAKLAGGRIFVLAGNHEDMLTAKQFQYVSPGELESYQREYGSIEDAFLPGSDLRKFLACSRGAALGLIITHTAGDESSKLRVAFTHTHARFESMMPDTNGVREPKRSAPALFAAANRQEMRGLLDAVIGLQSLESNSRFTGTSTNYRSFQDAMDHLVYTRFNYRVPAPKAACTALEKQLEDWNFDMQVTAHTQSDLVSQYCEGKGLTVDTGMSRSFTSMLPNFETWASLVEITQKRDKDEAVAASEFKGLAWKRFRPESKADPDEQYTNTDTSAPADSDVHGISNGRWHIMDCNSKGCVLPHKLWYPPPIPCKNDAKDVTKLC